MKPAIIKIVVVILLLLPVDNIKAQTKEQLNIALSQPGKPFVLHLRLQQGAIQVSSYTGNSIQIEAVPISEKTAPVLNTNQNQNKNVNTNTNINVHTPTTPSPKFIVSGKYISVIESANTITITPLVEKQKLSIVVRVPKSKGAFHLSSMLNADITASDLTGELDISNNAGQILLANISGSSVVSNVAGDITVSFTAVSENTPMAFSTVAGKLDVSFPSTLKANVKINSDNGKLFSDFEMGSSGQIGGGGADIRFKNMVGNIYIRKNK
jgi:hypothetical protein